MIVSHIGNNRCNFSFTDHRKLVSLELIAALRHFPLVWAFSLYVECIDIWSTNHDYLVWADWRNSWKVWVRSKIFRPDKIPFFLISFEEFGSI